MCEGVVRDCNLEHLAIGGDIQPHFRPSTESVTTRKIGAAFGYWFDFGDDWWHQINVVDFQTEVPKGTYPRVTKRVGESPPQHDDWDEDEDEDMD
jgi:pRiA4b ORF-3-like protein